MCAVFQKVSLSSKGGYGLLLILSFFFLLCLALAACTPQEVLKEERPISETSAKQNKGEEPTDPAETLLRVVDALERDDSKALLKDIYPLALERYGREQIVDRNAKIHTDLGITDIEYTNLVPIRDDNKKGTQIFYAADVNFTSKYGPISGNTLLSFIWHPAENAWQLDWNPSLILPGLEETGQVQVEILKARRGEIFDRAGWPLAINKKIAEVSIVPQFFDEEEIPQVNELLHLAEGTIEAKLNQTWVREDSLVPICLLPDLQNVDYKAFRTLQLYWAEKNSRYYPFRDALAPLIGYAGTVTADDIVKYPEKNLSGDDIIGKTGLEQIYDELLRGEDGFRIYISGSYEKSLIEQAAVDGSDLYLTIDAVGQRDLYEIIRDQNAAFSAMDPRTGDIIFLLSSPSYDPMDFVLGMSTRQYEQLLYDPKAPLTAKFSGATTPGSTQKLLTAIIALRNDPSILNDAVEITGKQWQMDESWGNYFVTRYRELDRSFTLEEALVYSDNIYFARLACEMGVEVFNEGMKKLGVGQPISQDYPFARSQISNHGDLGEEESILLADSSYGQGELLLSQIHLAQIYASLLNGGYLKELKLILDEEPALRDKQEPLITAEEIAVLSQAMERVVDEQYPEQMMRKEVALAGKSGTAELGLDASGETRINTWFVGYERDNPEICLTYTLFDSHLEEEPFVAHAHFADLFIQLYQDKGYNIPKTAFGQKRSLDEIPPFEYYQSKIDDEESATNPEEED